MGQERQRYVARAEAGKGWRIWDNKAKSFWGEIYAAHPVALIAELNAQKRPERLTELQKQAPRMKR